MSSLSQASKTCPRSKKQILARWLERGIRLMEYTIPKRAALAVLAGLLVLLFGSGFYMLVAGYHYHEVAQIQEAQNRYTAFFEQKVNNLEVELAALREEVQTQEGIYIKMLTILDRFQTNIPEADRRAFVEFVFREGIRRDLDPMLAMAVIKTESTFDTRAVSPVGARGLMQIMPYVGKVYAQELGIRYQGAETLFDPYINVRIGIYYLVELMKQYHGDFNMALEAYNRGPTVLELTLREGLVPSTHFAQRVLKTYARFQKI